MLKPTKEAFLKHDLYKLDIQQEYRESAYALENLPTVGHIKIASKGARFVYCDTDRKDGQMGWYADDGSGYFRVGVHGFGKMGGNWAKDNLTEPTPLENTRFRNPWPSHW
jgi:hypothetical protein